MAKTKMSSDDTVIDLLQKLIIIELAKQKVPQNDIARIVGVASVKVNTILKYFKAKK
jgi:hypothetical protein